MVKELYMKWLYRNCPGYIEFKGQPFWLDEGDSLRLYRNGSYSPFLVDTFCEFVGTGGTAIDCGASIGWFSVNAAARKDAKVLAFEPNPDQYGKLDENTCWYENIIPIHGGLWRERDTRPMWIDPDNGSGGRAFNCNGYNETQPIEFFTLDSMLKANNISNVDVVKLDCEGSELAILEGFQMIYDLRPTIITEYNHFALTASGFSPSKFWRTLFEYGDVAYINEEEGIYIRCERGKSMQEGNYLVTPHD